MNFVINDNVWEIKELDTKTLCDRFKAEEDEFLYGFTSYTENKIYLNETLCQERKEQVLKHELTHCWTMEYGYGFNDNFSREDVCNIVASINNFITENTNLYFKRNEW